MFLTSFLILFSYIILKVFSAVSYKRMFTSGSPGPVAHVVTLRKDPLYEDFGFSVSDGAFDKGVFVNRVRTGGPAYTSGAVHPYDRILQVRIWLQLKNMYFFTNAMF